MESGKLYDEIVEALKAAFPDPGDMDRVVGSADIGVSFGEYKVGRPTYPQALGRWSPITRTPRACSCRFSRRPRRRTRGTRGSGR